MKIGLVTNLKRQATKIFSDLRSSNEPVLFAEHGRPSAYLLDVEGYDSMQEQLVILEGVARGKVCYLEGRIAANSQAKERMAGWLK